MIYLSDRLMALLKKGNRVGIETTEDQKPTVNTSYHIQTSSQQTREAKTAASTYSSIVLNITAGVLLNCPVIAVFTPKEDRFPLYIPTVS